MFLRRIRTKKQRGFTLIEVLIAMVILSIALLGIAQLQITAILGNRFSYDTSVATSLASDALEQLVHVYSADPAQVTCPPKKAFVRSNLTFTRVCSLIGIQSGQRKVTMTVTWRNASGADRSVVVGSFL